MIKKKNPYLFKAKNIESANDIVESISDAFISSAEETIFGDWLEGLAIYVCGIVYNGRKSSTNGIDLEFDKDNIRYIVSIKSGPNWGNSSQVIKMKDQFKTAKKVLRTSNSQLRVEAINGCCYGKDSKPDKGEYYKYCGQEFWSFISGDENLYLDIIEPLAINARERNNEFVNEYSKMINVFNRQFIDEFCKQNGEIDWQKILKFNSGKNVL